MFLEIMPPKITYGMSLFILFISILLNIYGGKPKGCGYEQDVNRRGARPV